MENGKFKHFKDDIRRTFTLYALIPVIIITFSSYMFSFFIWYRTVIKQNYDINNEISRKIESIVSSYIREAYNLSEQENIMEDINSHDNSIMYQKLYNFVNSKDVRSNFFIFDKDMNPIIASTKKIPEYALKENMFSWGITRRMLDTPNQTVIEKQSYDINSKQILSVGKAIIADGRISGYITFDLHEEDLSRIISRNFSVDAAITDKYTNIVSTTNKLLTNKFGKISDNFRDRPGFIKSGDDSQYMVKSQILDGNISVYTITSIGYITSIFILVGVLLIILFITLSLTMHFSAKKIADSKTKAIDDIIEGISNVQNGNLDTFLNINTKDEFQIIAESYNKMLIDIKNLIEVNKEKATQNILSEIKQLESQFDPHFLFNTLEMIRCMSALDPDSVNKVILSLSALLRYSINNNIHNVTLGEDIEYTENYLMIQKYRFGRRFNYSIDVDKKAADCIVPKLIIQPIIENAIKYGFGDRMELSVDIKADIARDDLVIVISDNGVGMEAAQLGKIQRLLEQEKNNSAYIGLFNVHRRIQLMYGNTYGLNIKIRDDSGITVSLNLPVNRSDDYAESADN
ncbi:MAG TPA: histidine kinase [Clostridia bacterium]|nr:histidine kinase [Clostridia bacterium]